MSESENPKGMGTDHLRSRKATAGKDPSRRWVYAGSVVVLVLALVALVVSGSNGGGVGGERGVVYGDALEQFPAETASDVVSWADQVSVVTAVGAVELFEEDVPAERDAAGEGLINREVTFRVDKTIWHRSGAPSLEGTFDAIEFGWVLRGGEKARFTAMGTPWIEEGSQYLMPLAYDQDVWASILPSAVFPYKGGRVTPAEHQDTALAGELADGGLDRSAAVFNAAEPDPVVAKYFDLPPTERQNAVMAERQAGVGGK